MAEARVWTFFYGSYMNLDVLREMPVTPASWERARLPGFDIVIQPRANLVRSERESVYGVLATLTHRELDRLYTHARDVLGETYLPEAVLVERLVGGWKAALCYTAPTMRPRPADPAYVERILKPARDLGFPAGYLRRLERFRGG
ncbi:MAG TPA: gamma-glutamylcyclotransferase family protein [Candidatus Polarisedimenticolaceae bacterium]|nr:gamma-glutamylcyclotransferase family protein [Candidatus Polarisedimenticolaceae bacterium]